MARFLFNRIRTSRGSKNSSIIPAKVMPSIQHCLREIQSFRPFWKRQRHFVKCQSNIISFVSFLLFPRCPTNITRFIVSIVIGVSVQAVSGARRITNLSVKFLKRSKFAGNSSPPVIRKVFSVRVSTASYHRSIGIANLCIVQTVNKVVALFSSYTSTAFYRVVFSCQGISQPKRTFPTITERYPKQTPAPTIISSQQPWVRSRIQNQQSTNALARQILRSQDAPPLGVLRECAALSEVLSFGSDPSRQLGIA